MAHTKAPSQWVSRLFELKPPPWFFAELIIAAAVITFLAFVAHRQYQWATGQAEMNHVFAYFHFTRSAIEFSWNMYGRFPQTLEESFDEHAVRTFADFHRGESLGSRLPSEIADVNYDPSGAITFHMRSSHPALKGRKITFRPVITGTEGAQRILWICGNQSPPEGAVVNSENHTNLPSAVLPHACRH
jgi:hypothetical protein